MEDPLRDVTYVLMEICTRETENTSVTLLLGALQIPFAGHIYGEAKIKQLHRAAVYRFGLCMLNSYQNSQK